MNNTTEDDLRPPEAVPELPEDQAVGMVAVTAEREAELETRARDFIRELAAVDIQVSTPLHAFCVIATVPSSIEVPEIVPVPVMVLQPSEPE